MASLPLERLLNQLTPSDVWLVRACLLAIANEDWMPYANLPNQIGVTAEQLSHVIDFFSLTQRREPTLTDDAIVDATLRSLRTVRLWMSRLHYARRFWIDAPFEDVLELHERLTA